MPIRYKSDLKYSEVTPLADYLDRRSFIGAAGTAALGLAMPTVLNASAYDTVETPNSFEEITSYTNFYEFGFDKGDAPAKAHRLTTDPWSIEIGGLVERPGTYDRIRAARTPGAGGRAVFGAVCGLRNPVPAR